MRRNPVATAFVAFVMLVFLGGAWWHHRVQREIELVKQTNAIDALGRQLLDGLFRGQTDDAEHLISRATELGAPPEWLSFHRGIKELFRQDYEESKQHFENVRGAEQYSVKATALLAIANMWSGSEYQHFLLLSQIDAAKAQSFEDKFFLGYAHTWGNSRLSYQLLKDASAEREGLVFVRFFRGVAAREVAAFACVDPIEKMRFIDEAVEDIEWAASELKTPLALKEQTIAYLHLAKIYQKLVEIDPGKAEAYKTTIESAKTRALSLLDELRANETHSDAQYALVMLLSELKPELIRELADDWLTRRINVSSCSAHFLAIHFASIKEYATANQWLVAAGRKDGINIQNLVKFVNPKRQQSVFQLRQELCDRIDRRINAGKTENIGFDVMTLSIMGDKSYLKHYKKDQMEMLIDRIWGDECTSLIANYLDPAIKMTAAELIARCEDAPAANAALMHANFCLGAEAIAEKRWSDAKRHFEDCRNGGQIMFTVYFLSDLLLQHRQDWERWAAEWESESN